MALEMENQNRSVIDVEDLVKTYPHKAGEVVALRSISFQVRAGEFVSIMGQSGSGKSTLLHVLGCLHGLTTGRYLLDGEDVSTLDDLALSQIRNEKVGIVFQKFNLLPQENLIDNVSLPLIYGRVSKRERERRAREKLALVGLSDRIAHRPTELSGGQSQRAAIARALIVEPALLLADEPTGNLDSQTGDEIMSVFQELHRAGRTIVQVTHDRERAEYSDRIIHLRDGLIDREERIAEPRVAPPMSVRGP